MSDGFSEWIERRGILEVECLVSDMNGILRGKVLPATKFLKAERSGALRMPSSVFSVTVRRGKCLSPCQDASEIVRSGDGSHG
jgi:glutamine synthetase